MSTTIRVLFHETGEFVLPDYTLYSVGPACLERYIDVPAGIQATYRFQEYLKNGLAEMDIASDASYEGEVIHTEEVKEEAPVAAEETVPEEEKPEKKTRRKKGDA